MYFLQALAYVEQQTHYYLIHHMKILSLISLTVLLFSLAACSSGGSTGTEGTNNAGTTDSTGTDAELGSDTGGTDSSGSPSSGNGPEEDDPIPVAEKMIPIHDRLFDLTFRTLSGFNKILSSGESLTADQQECIADYDPALGNVVLLVDCAQPQSVDMAPLFANRAALLDTPDCQSSMAMGQPGSCILGDAIFTVNTLWFIPATNPGQPERPQPKAGAFLDYNAITNQLLIESLPDALSGNFSCTFNVATGTLVESSGFADCENELPRLVSLIDEHLSQATAEQLL